MKSFYLVIAAAHVRCLDLLISITYLVLIAPISAQVSQTPAQLEVIPNAPAPPIASAQVDPFSDPFIKQIQVRHEKAVKGDAKETKSLTTDLEKWTQEQPMNYLLQAYLGSVYTLDSRDAWPGPGKLSYLRKGTQWLDGAVASAPNNPAVRFIRAIDYFELPAIFGKRQTAREDFQLLLKQIDGETKSNYILDTRTQQGICLYAGKSYYQLADYSQAKEAWLKGYKLSPASDLGKKIGDELMKVK